MSEVWAYGGRRRDDDGKIVHAWYPTGGGQPDPSGARLFGPRNLVSGAFVGSLWRVHVDHKPGGGVSVTTAGKELPGGKAGWRPTT